MALYLLFEAASGYALFEAEGMNELAQETDALQQVSLLTRTKTWARRGTCKQQAGSCSNEAVTPAWQAV